MAVKQLDIKNKSYYFYNDLIKLSNFSVNNLKLDKKNWKDIDIYYIGYADKNKPQDWKVNSVHPLHSIINKVFRFVGEKNDVKYLNIDKLKIFSGTIRNQVFSGIEYYTEMISGEEVNFDRDFEKNRFVSNDLLPLEKLIYFPTLTNVIRCVLKQADIFYPQVYLDDALYQL